MKRILLSLLCACVTLVAAHALTLDEIRNSGNYYWGEGTHAEAARADAIALEMLASQISVSVNSHTSLVNKSASVRKTGTKERKDERSEYVSVINTYTQATVENSSTLTFPEGDNTRIIRYIEKSKVYKVFESRRRQITTLLENAEEQLRLGKIDVVLKNYYWAYALLRSMPGTSDEEWRGKVLCQYIPQAIDDVLDGIDVRVLSREGNDFDLAFTYAGKPVTSVDYYCIEGGFPGPLCNAGEGRGEASLISRDPVDRIEIEIEYRYKDQASDAQMMAVLQGVSDYRTKRATRFVNADGSGTAPIVAESSKSSSQAPKAQQASVPEASTEAQVLPREMINPTRYQGTVKELLGAIAQKARPSAVSSFFTDEGARKYAAIIRSGNARVVDADNLHFWQSSQGNPVCRGAVMAFRYNSGKYRTFTKDLVFSFDSDGLIDNISLGLGEAPRNNILGETSIPEMIRHAIVEFIENYQTAFALKDIDYMRTIFDDNAIIITGTVLRQGMPTEDYWYRNNEKIIYNRLTKDQYLTRLKATFDSREYVNLRFDNISVVRIDEDAEVYGIQLEQDYFSPSYCDHGYLYLQFQIKDPANPVIHVRTWQPGSVDIRELFNHTDFKIFR